MLIVIDGDNIKKDPTASSTLCTPAMSDPPVVVFTERAGKPGGAKGCYAGISPERSQLKCNGE